MTTLQSCHSERSEESKNEVIRINNKKMKKHILLFLSIVIGTAIYAQKPIIKNIERIEPLNWWIGFKDNKVQLIVYGKNIAQRDVKINYPGVLLNSAVKVENPNYLFLNLVISDNTKPGKFPITFSKEKEQDIIYTYELKERNTRKPDGVSSKDFVYLIMPDRFANGDYSNDIVKGMRETTINRDSMFYRHGGDLQGIINNLNYLEKLGVTALWLTPVLENDESSASYHGYAMTESYHIDRRFGTNELYKKLADELHKRNMKIVMDVVPNHLGTEHYTNMDLPMKNWVHQWDTFTKSNFHDQAVFDPYGSQIDKKVMTEGWFDRRMADMNQQNEFCANYITQSHIWWIEYAGIDGFRIDTYPYNDPEFMAWWAKKIKDEYPTFNMFGEAWVNGVVNEAAFGGGDVINRGIDTHLPGLTDFQSLWAIGDAMNKPFGFNDGVMKVYGTLAKDFVYQKPFNNVVFLGNHDLSRFLSVAGENKDKMKSAATWLLTTRGIPQWYYADEILYNGFSNPDGLIRQDFQGGWKEDKVNKFTEAGRTKEENDMYNYVATIANYRKNNPVLQTGKLMQYIPKEGVYVYFRYNDSKTVMVIMNTNEKEIFLKTPRFSERMKGFTSGVNIVTKENISLSGEIKVPGNSTSVLELI